MTQVGDRVGALSHSEEGVVFFYGYGTYMGRVKPVDSEAPNPAGTIGEMVVEMGVENPLIRLDSGKYVWGCECWWGSEEQVKQRLAPFDEVREVDIDERRAQAAAEEQE